ncbi:MAG TPA: bifunctional hydroxymethylpyrimidine kinase/phosphomethylpyrimidine kinase, partial [Pyrinomonadaceae bacterium]|nr:bifunctional hydroxymethylpyrimidine kinase/phosphomethylpyrimidine kinase [Pyrinomonadaceae bacterium]
RLATPNIPEAERITGLEIKTEADMRRAAALIRREMGARAVLVKGGHLSGDADALDLLDDEGRIQLFRAPRIQTDATHGTGCTLAASIAACLARGMELTGAVGAAKRFVTEAIRRSPHIGRGFSPVNHNLRVRFDERGGIVFGED